MAAALSWRLIESVPVRIPERARAKERERKRESESESEREREREIGPECLTYHFLNCEAAKSSNIVAAGKRTLSLSRLGFTQFKKDITHFRRISRSGSTAEPLCPDPSALKPSQREQKDIQTEYRVGNVDLHKYRVGNIMTQKYLLKNIVVKNIKFEMQTWTHIS
ncbi:uncharacterized protein LOC144783148 [Lissotriton helveticus]